MEGFLWISGIDHIHCSRILAYLDLYGEAELMLSVRNTDEHTSRGRLHRRFLRRRRTPQTRVGLGVEGIPEPEPKVPEEPEAPGESLSPNKVHCWSYVARIGHIPRFHIRPLLSPFQISTLVTHD